MTVRGFVTTFSIATAVTSAAQDSRPTIPELLKRQAPEPLLQTRQSELVPRTLEEIAPSVDLLVHGTIASANVYLTNDKRDLYTDYTVVPFAHNPA